MDMTLQIGSFDNTLTLDNTLTVPLINNILLGSFFIKLAIQWKSMSWIFLKLCTQLACYEKTINPNFQTPQTSGCGVMASRHFRPGLASFKWQKLVCYLRYQANFNAIVLLGQRVAMYV